MDLRLNEEQKMLKTAARDFLVKECPKALVRELEENKIGYTKEIWQKMADLGWIGMVIPEEYQGMGMKFQDLAVLVEEMGYNILPAPFLCTLISSSIILRFGSEKQKKSFLPKIARGEIIMTTAILEESGNLAPYDINLKAVEGKGAYTLTGKKLFVEMANIADYIICAARTSNDEKRTEDGISLFIIETKQRGIQCEIIPTMGMEKLCEVQFTNVAVPGENLLGELHKGWAIVEKLIQEGSLLKCVESIGGIQACIDMTINYLKDRVQYGRPIGSFQALQHIAADIWIAMQTSRYLVYEAVWMKSEGISCEHEISMAKSYVNETYKMITKWVVRLHGGIGTSRDYDAGLYYRRAKAADTIYGSTFFHREKIAQKIGLK
jgi:alkylation response protein AidB-like acyl-CoA dehydrogenase